MIITCRCGVPGPDVLGLLRHIIQNHDGPLYNAAAKAYRLHYEMKALVVDNDFKLLEKTNA